MDPGRVKPSGSFDCGERACAPKTSSTDCVELFREAIVAWTSVGQLESAQESRRQLAAYLAASDSDRAAVERTPKLTQESVLLEVAQVYEHAGITRKARAAYRELAGPVAPPKCEPRNPTYVEKANMGNEVSECSRKSCEETREQWMRVLELDAGLLLDDFEKHPELGVQFFKDCRAGGISESDAIGPMLAVAGSVPRPAYAGGYAHAPTWLTLLTVLGRWIDAKGVSQAAAARLRTDFAGAYDRLGDCKSAAQLFEAAGVSSLSSDCVQELATRLVSDGRFAEALTLCATNRKTYDEPWLIARSLTLRANSACLATELGSDPSCMSPEFLMKDATLKVMQRLNRDAANKLVGYLKTELRHLSDRCLSEGPKAISANCRSKLDSLDYAIRKVNSLSNGNKRREK